MIENVNDKAEEHKLNLELAKEITNLAFELTQPEGSYESLYELCFWFINRAVEVGHAEEDILEDFVELVQDKESLAAWGKVSIPDYKLVGIERNILALVETICSWIVVETVVYLIRNPLLSIHKIGISRNVYHRLRTLTNACGIQLDLVTTYRSNYRASDMENRLHQHFSSKRLKGEWFSDIDEEMFNAACVSLDKSLP